MASKIYLRGNAKEVTFQNGGKIVNFSVNVKELEDILKIVNERKEASDYKVSDFLNLSIGSRRSKDDYGNTHLVWTNEMFIEDGDVEKIKELRRADMKANGLTPTESSPAAKKDDDDGDTLPF